MSNINNIWYKCSKCGTMYLFRYYYTDLCSTCLTTHRNLVKEKLAGHIKENICKIHKFNSKWNEKKKSTKQ